MIMRVIDTKDIAFVNHSAIEVIIRTSKQGHE